MSFNEYQNGTIKTWKAKDKPREEQLANAAFGIAGEAGEAVDIIKKMLYPSKPADKDLTALEKKMLDELGDLLYYVATMARLCGWSLETVAQHNADKLAERHDTSLPDALTQAATTYLKGNYVRAPEQVGEVIEKNGWRVERLDDSTLLMSGAPEIDLGDSPDDPPLSALDQRLSTIEAEIAMLKQSIYRIEKELRQRTPPPLVWKDTTTSPAMTEG